MSAVGICINEWFGEGVKGVQWVVILYVHAFVIISFTYLFIIIIIIYFYY